MANVICIMGESGSGKTTCMRTLDPATTFYIDADRKGLSWKGWKDQFNDRNRNYLRSSDKGLIAKVLDRIGDPALPDPDYEHIKVVVVDTINGIMIDDEFKRMGEKNYDKWADLAASVYNLVTDAYMYREDLTVIFTAHTQTERDDAGFAFTRIKTSGRKLDKIVLESKFTTVLLAKCINGRYMLETRANNSTTKSPMGAFASSEIDNDIQIVLKALEGY